MVERARLNRRRFQKASTPLNSAAGTNLQCCESAQYHCLHVASCLALHHHTPIAAPQSHCATDQPRSRGVADTDADGNEQQTCYNLILWIFTSRGPF